MVGAPLTPTQAFGRDLFVFFFECERSRPDFEDCENPIANGIGGPVEVVGDGGGYQTSCLGGLKGMDGGLLRFGTSVCCRCDRSEMTTALMV